MQGRLPLIFMLNYRRLAAFDFAAPAILIQSFAQGRYGEFERFGLIQHYNGLVAQFEEAVSAVRQRSAFCIVFRVHRPVRGLHLLRALNRSMEIRSVAAD